MYGYNFTNNMPVLPSGLTPQYYNNAPYTQYRTPQGALLRGRIVTSVDEAKAAQIELDGGVSYFPCPASNRIYTKAIGMDGMPIFVVYEAQKQEQQTQYANGADVAALASRVAQLEKIIKDLGGDLNNDTTTNIADNAK